MMASCLFCNVVTILLNTLYFVLDRVKEVSCEENIESTKAYYAKTIDPLLVEIRNGLSDLAPLVPSFNQGVISSKIPSKAGAPIQVLLLATPVRI